jgi:hypothetical protein
MEDFEWQKKKSEAEETEICHPAQARLALLPFPHQDKRRPEVRVRG